MNPSITWDDIATASDGKFNPAISASLQLEDKHMANPILPLADLAKYGYKAQLTKNESLSPEEQKFAFANPQIGTPAYNATDDKFMTAVSYTFTAQVELTGQ